jgi:hypothetical protein
MSTEPPPCNCKVCQDHRRWMAAINPQSDEAKAALDEIMTRLAQAETDATIWELKSKGKWP